MFLSKSNVKTKGAKSGRGRFEYLQTLVTEYQDTDKADSKNQILANLANFAYDPLNYEYLRQLNVVDLFIDVLDEDDDSRVEFAIGGLCNVTVDETNRQYVVENDGVTAVVNCLSSSREETVLNALTTLINLLTPQSKKEILSDELVDCVKQLTQSTNPRLRNLSTIFVEDYCS